MAYLTASQIETEYSAHLDEDWDEYAPHAPSGKLWVTKVKGMVRIAKNKKAALNEVVFYYRSYPLCYDPEAEWERAEREDAAARGIKRTKRNVPAWMDMTAVGFGGETADEIKAAIDAHLSR